MSANKCRFLFDDTGIGHLKERIYNLPDGHFDKSVEDLFRPNTYRSRAGDLPLELVATPEAVVGRASLAKAGKTMRAVAAIVEYIDLLCDDILNTWPAGTVPDP